MEDLERHRAVVLPILRQVNGSHAARAKLAKQAIRADALPRLAPGWIGERVSDTFQLLRAGIEPRRTG